MLRKRLAKIFSVFLVMTMVISANIPSYANPPKPGQPISNGLYEIETSLEEGKMIDVQGSRTDKDAQIHIWQHHGLHNQLFYFYYDTSDGCYTIIPMVSRKCLGVDADNPAKGTWIRQYETNFRNGFKWKVLPVNGGCYQFQLKANGLMLDVHNGQTADGTRLKLWQSNGSNAQKFKLKPRFKNDVRVTIVFLDVIDQARELRAYKNIELTEASGKITDESMYPMENVESVEINSNVTSIGDKAFYRNGKIRTVTADPKWLSRFNKANLKKIILPYGVKKISKGDLRGCTNLEYLEIPRSVTEIEDGAFDDLKSVNTWKCDLKWQMKFHVGPYKIPDEVKILRNDFGGERIDIECTPDLLQKINYKDNIVGVVVPSGVKKISKNDFSGLRELRFLELPSTIQEIEKGAFDECPKIDMTSVKCDPKWYRYINPKIYLVQENTTKLTKPMFDGWKELEVLIFNKNNKVNEIEPGTFDSCENLEVIRCEPKWIKYFKHRARLKSVIVPEEVKKISKDDFKGCTGLERLRLFPTVEEIEDGAFDDCLNIKDAVCDNLAGMRYFKYETVRIPDDVTDLKKSMFKGFTSLQHLEIPSTVKSIEPDTFEDCVNLVSVKCDPKWYNLFTKYNLTTVGVPEQVKTVDYKVFDQFKQAQKIEVPETTQLTNVPQEALHQTTVDDLVKADPNNAAYAPCIKQILADVEKGTVNSKGDAQSLGDISAKVTVICQKIKKQCGKTIRPVQCLAVLRLCDQILNGKSKGAIGEVKTGEGKSLIIAVAAIVSAQYGRHVDIVTSTLYLAKRDQEEQKAYYDMFGIQSGVLYNLGSDREYLDSESSANSEDLHFNREVFEYPIVYSTNYNFQFAYLEGMFGKSEPRGERPFDVVIVDEIDNMLIDQAMSPAVLSVPLKIKNCEQVLKTVYELRDLKPYAIRSALMDKLKEQYDLELISELQDAVRTALRLTQNVEYHMAQDGKVVIIDGTTGSAKPGCKWSKYLHPMVEIKEGIRQTGSSASYCGITQKSYFNMYKRIVGLTGTVGPESDQDILKKSYKVEIFKVPRDKERVKLIRTVDKESSGIPFDRVYEEIKREQAKGRPVLAIFESKKDAELFLSVYPEFINTVLGVDPPKDREAINRAGDQGVVTIATNAAGRGVDIKLQKNELKSGGLHVLIVQIPKNERTLEQAIGRSGRQGQPGSVTVYLGKDDHYVQTPNFDEGYEILLKLTRKFSRYVKETWPWIYEGDGQFTMFDLVSYRLGVTPGEILDVTAKQILNILGHDPIFSEEGKKTFDDFIYQMVISSWGQFFTDMEGILKNNPDRKICKMAYEKFLEELHQWVPEDCKTDIELLHHLMAKRAKDILENIDWERVVITVAITAAGIATATIAGPGAAVVVSTLSGAALEGSLSVYDQLQAGGGVDLGRVGISALAGGAKGFTIASPMGALATGVTVGGISASQNITDSVIAGNMSPEALKRAIVTGTVEGVTAGGLKWVGNKFEARQAAKAQAHAKLEASQGGSKAPKLATGEGSKVVEKCSEEYTPYTAEMRKHIIPPKDGYDAFLERKYIKIRQAGLDDIKIVAKNTGLSEQDLIKLKKHVFLDTHNLSYKGKPLEKLYFQADPEIAHAWERAIEGNLSVEEKKWFEQLLKHELTESVYMQQGMPLRDPSTYDVARGYVENPSLNAHDKANLTARQPKEYPGYDCSKEVLKYEDQKIYY